MPDSLKKVLGDSVIEGQSAREVARIFGVGHANTSSYANGTDTKKANADLMKHIMSTRRSLASRAEGKLGRALEYITDDKLESAKARDLAGIAKDMSAVIRNLEPVNESVQSNTNFVFYTPKTKSEEDFVTVEVKDVE
jgi:predicted transcriptional regulator